MSKRPREDSSSGNVSETSELAVGAGGADAAKRHANGCDDDGMCEALQKCVVRWGLLAPFVDADNNDAWQKYLIERAALEFRHEHCWDEEDGEIESKAGAIIASPELEKLWHDDFGMVGINMPELRRICEESYAEDCHESGTTKGQYTELIDSIRDRVATTIASCSKLPAAETTAKAMADGTFLISYWVNFEASSTDATPRTVHLESRMYSPIGNGQSLDLHWQFHFRSRSYGCENFAQLQVQPRELSDSRTDKPAEKAFDDNFFEGWRSSDGSTCLAALSGPESGEGKVRKHFATKRRLTELRDGFIGKTKACVLSPRKMLGLMARAAGVCAFDEPGGWVFHGMRTKHKLDAGEESDGLEDGEKDGPSGCVIS